MSSDSISLPEAFTNAIYLNAFHDSPHRLQAPKCHTDTQAYGKRGVLQWLKSLKSLEGSTIGGLLWVQGLIGSGKTTLLQTFSEGLLPPISENNNNDKHIVSNDGFNDLSGVRYNGTSFFFDEDEGINNGNKFFLTVAYGLARDIPTLSSFILAAFYNNPNLTKSPLQVQFDSLILNPLRSWVSSTSKENDTPLDLLFIIDGLDICLDADVQVEIINVIRGSFEKSPLRGVRCYWIISSRPESWLRPTFFTPIAPHYSSSSSFFFKPKPTPTPKRIEAEVKELPLPLPTDSEILLYLRDEFRHLCSSTFGDEEKEWPTEVELQALQRKCHNNYLLASSFLSYIFFNSESSHSTSSSHLGNYNPHPKQRLSEILSYSPNSSSSFSVSWIKPEGNPFFKLDKTYLKLLNKTPHSLRPLTKRILGYILCTQPSSSLSSSSSSSSSSSLYISSNLKQRPNILELSDLLSLSPSKLYHAITHLYSIISAPPIPKNEILNEDGVFYNSLKVGVHWNRVVGFLQDEVKEFLSDKRRSGNCVVISGFSDIGIEEDENKNEDENGDYDGDESGSGWYVNKSEVEWEIARVCLRRLDSELDWHIEKGNDLEEEKVEIWDWEGRKRKFGRYFVFTGNVNKLVCQRWFWFCWRSEFGENFSSNYENENENENESETETKEKKERVEMLLKDLKFFNWGVFLDLKYEEEDAKYVDRSFVEWLMRAQETRFTKEEDKLIKPGSLVYVAEFSTVSGKSLDENTRLLSKAPTYTLGSPSKQVYLVPVYDENKYERLQMEENVGKLKELDPMEDSWNSIKAFWIVQRGGAQKSYNVNFSDKVSNSESEFENMDSKREQDDEWVDLSAADELEHTKLV